MTCLKILNFFWKGQVVVIKSRVVGYVLFLEVLHSFVEVLHYVAKSPTVSLYHSLKKLTISYLFFTFGFLHFP